MTEPIVVRFTLTVDGLVEALRVHSRLDQSYGLRAWMFGCRLIGFLSLVYLFWNFRLDWTAFFMGPLVVLGIVAFLFLLFLNSVPWNRWLARLTLKKQPESARDVEWTFSEDQLEQRTSLTTTSMNWELVTKVVEVPRGFLIYQGKLIFHWIPAEAFESSEDRERFVRLAESRTKFVSVGEF